MARSTEVQEDDVGIRPSRASRSPDVRSVPPGASPAFTPAPPGASTAPGASGFSSPPGPATIPAPAPLKCEALFELFRGGAGSVFLGRLTDGKTSTQLVALRRLANLPTRNIEAAMNLAQLVMHPRLTKMLGTFQHEESWYLASEYASGITLFELGQTAVRERTPLAAPVAVRIVLDALTVTAEVDQLIGGTVSAARCLYPESIWISDSGKIFMSEILVAPVLARTTTGASYVAVTQGMSAQATDVRAAAVELARLACARLMNGNPASWQTKELPAELSELLLRAVSGGKGTENLAAFANALASLDPKLIADREAVQAEVERLMGSERVRRHDKLETLQEKTVDTDTTRVFRVAPSTSRIPEADNAISSAVYSQDAVTQTALELAALTSTPPKKPRPTAATMNPTPTVTTTPPTPPPATTPDSPISGIWREAHARMAVPGRRSRARSTTGEFDLMTPAPATAPAPLRSPSPAPAAVVAAPSAPVAPTVSKRVLFALLIAAAVVALLAAGWVVRGTVEHRGGTTQQAR